jgi:5-methylcytosine-specific restriction endonuclease McrA
MNPHLKQFYEELRTRPTKHVTLDLLQKYAALPRIRSNAEIRPFRDEFQLLKRETPLLRSKHRCGICRTSWRVQLHHIVPLGCGGGNSLFNLIPLCAWHHSRIHPWLSREEPDWLKRFIHTFHYMSCLT